jgi:predicted component of type VI protein secretion system
MADPSEHQTRQPDFEGAIAQALADLAGTEECGPNLEYERAFLELEWALHPEGAGTTESGPAQVTAPDWHSLERQALALLAQSKDVRLAAVVARAWVRLHGVNGLAAGLRLLQRLVAKYWASIHPQLDADDHDDPTMRLNALALLAHHEGLLADLRAHTLAWKGLVPITLRELELALGRGPRRASHADETVRALRDADQTTAALGNASAAAFLACRDLERQLIEKVGPQRALDLSPLRRLIDSLCLTFPERASPPALRFGLCMPRRIDARQGCTARFVQYDASHEERVRRLLRELDGADAGLALGLSPERALDWRVGMKVRVRLHADGLTCEPSEREFEWDGTHNIVSFRVTRAEPAVGPVVLTFEASVEGVTIASVPLTVELGMTTAAVV